MQPQKRQTASALQKQSAMHRQTSSSKRRRQADWLVRAWQQITIFVYLGAAATWLAKMTAEELLGSQLIGR